MATFVRDGRSRRSRRCPKRFRAWMSHGDEGGRNCPRAGAGWAHRELRRRRGGARAAPFHLIQFHPEVVHSALRQTVLANFLFQWRA